MQEIDVDPHEIGIWSEGSVEYKVPLYYEEHLENVVERDGWDNIPRVPIFELHQGYKHKYVLVEGHSRHDAAIKTNSRLPCNLYAHDEPIDVNKDGLAPFEIKDESIKKDYFPTVFKLYIKFQETKTNSTPQF